MGFRDDHHTRVGSPLFSEVGGILAQRMSEFDPQGLTNLIWSFANIKHQPPEKMVDSCVERFDSLWSELKPQEISNALWAFERLGSSSPAHILQTWLEGRRSGPHFDEWSGEQLLKLTVYLEACLPTSSARDIAVKAFEERHFDPICAFFHAQLPRMPAAMGREDYVHALRRFELFHLGPHFTALALERLTVALPRGEEEDAFCASAREALFRHYLEGDDAPARQESAMLRGGQTTSRWVAAEVCFDVSGIGDRVLSGRRTVPAEIIPRPAEAGREAREQRRNGAAAIPSPQQTSGQTAETGFEWLWSVPLAGDVERSTHCEFVALRQLASEMCKLGACPDSTSAPAVRGRVWMFVSHYPCLSCLGVFAQFRNRFPNVSIGIVCVEWSDWQRDLLRALGKQ
jgi:hypothetical protein